MTMFEIPGWGLVQVVDNEPMTPERKLQVIARASARRYRATGKPARRKSYIINEANGDRHAGSFKTYEAAVRAIRRYSEADMERCQPAIGAVLPDGSVTYEI